MNRIFASPFAPAVAYLFNIGRVFWRFLAAIFRPLVAKFKPAERNLVTQVDRANYGGKTILDDTDSPWDLLAEVNIRSDVKTIASRSRSRSRSPSAGRKSSKSIPSTTSSEVHWVNRKNCAAIEAIEDASFVRLLLQHRDPDHKLDRSACKVEYRTGGTFNHCVILSLAGHGRFAIKVPYTGIPGTWEEGDAHNLRSEARTMEYVRRNTDIPVPEVITFDEWLDNKISAPYIMMRAITGKPASSIWVSTDPDGTRNYRTNDRPSVFLYELRCQFLDNLAHAMAELSRLEFDKLGMLNFDTEEQESPEVGHYFVDAGDGTMTRLEAYTSSHDYLRAQLQEFQSTTEMTDLLWGVSTLYKTTIKTAPFQKTSHNHAPVKETFVLAHPDLDFQNIYVDDEGNITGIIDWDGTLTVPHYIGYASAPRFLRKDWEPEYDHEFGHTPWILEHYRQLYAKYMAQALTMRTGEAGDSKYTLKSPLYHAVFYAFGHDQRDCPALVSMLFKMIPGFRALDKQAALEKLGSDDGWDTAVDMLLTELQSILAPCNG